MRSRPRPDRRRGLIRAAIVVSLLVALLVAALLIVSSLLAPPVNAPTAPLTPGPLTPVTTPGVSLTPVPTIRAGTPLPTSPPVATPKTAPTGTKTKIKDIALGVAKPSAKHAVSGILRKLASQPAHSRAIALQFSWQFQGGGDAYAGRSLAIRDRVHPSTMLRIGRADPYVQPVWSPSQRSLYFVRVREVQAPPAAQWTLWRWDRGTRRSHQMVSVRALALIPLGMSDGKFLYVVSRPADSVILALSGGRSRFLTTLISQPISSAFLAPNGSSIAFAVPSSCAVCTVDIYDLKRLWIAYGPSGAPSDLDIAWLADGSGLLTYEGQKLVTMTNQAQITGWYSPPAHLPRRWESPMSIHSSAGNVYLTDTATGRGYLAHRASGA